MERKIDITICSDLDYENLIAEISVNNRFIGLVTNEPDKGVCFEIPKGQVSFESIELCIFIDALNEARKRISNS